MLFAACMAGFTADAQDSPPASAAGEWEITLTFVVGTATHTAIIEQEDEKITGTYKGMRLKGELNGKTDSKQGAISFTSRLRHEATGITYWYIGKIIGDKMQGIVTMGEYWTAQFTAKRKK